MMLDDFRQLPELRYMKNRHNTNESYFDYEKDIFNRTLSPHIFQNPKLAGFIDGIAPMASLMFDKFNIVKNFKNYMVGKYHYKQKG